LILENTNNNWTFNRSLETLKKAGLRPTQQRLALVKILFENGHRHVTAEQLHKEAAANRVPISLATVYNTLNQLVKIGLLKITSGDGQKVFFDTNTTDPHHFWWPEKDALIDVSKDEVIFANLPVPPPGTEIDRVEVKIYLKKAGK
jgi:Fur family iron response transcriptional regulator